MVIEISPDFAHGHLNLGLIYLSQGRIEAALEEMRQADPGAFRLYGLALAQHSAGQGMEADAALSELIEEYASGAAVQIAQVHAWRGEAEKAFEWLDRAYVQRDSGLSETLVEPLFRNLKGDPRWRTFLARMRLPPES
jgi:tetratricopeptide (TPR) repeat protein